MAFRRGGRRDLRGGHTACMPPCSAARTRVAGPVSCAGRTTRTVRSETAEIRDSLVVRRFSTISMTFMPDMPASSRAPVGRRPRRCGSRCSIRSRSVARTRVYLAHRFWPPRCFVDFAEDVLDRRAEAVFALCAHREQHVDVRAPRAEQRRCRGGLFGEPQPCAAMTQRGTDGVLPWPEAQRPIQFSIHTHSRHRSREISRCPGAPRHRSGSSARSHGMLRCSAGRRPPSAVGGRMSGYSSSRSGCVTGVNGGSSSVAAALTPSLHAGPRTTRLCPRVSGSRLAVGAEQAFLEAVIGCAGVPCGRKGPACACNCAKVSPEGAMISSNRL